MAFANWVVGTHVYGCWISGVHGSFEGHIFRDIDHHGTRTAGTRNVEGLFHDVGHLSHVFDQEIVFDDGAGDANGVAFLKCIQSDGMCRNLAGDDDHGDAVHVGRGNTGNSVGHARTRCDQRYTDFTGGTCVAICGMNGCLLMSNKHMFYGVLFVKGVVNMQNSAAWVTPNELDTFGLQRFDQDIGAIDFDGGLAQRTGLSCGLEFRFGDFHDVTFVNFANEKTRVPFCNFL